MKKYLIIGITLFAFSTILGQITLEQCEQKAFDNYPQIKQYQLIEKSKEYNLSNANKAYFPQLSFTGIAGWVDGMPQISLPGQKSESDNFHLIGLVQLNQTIWDGGITSNNKDAITAENGIDKANLDIAMHSIKDRVDGLYFGILLLNEQQSVLNTLQRTLKNNLSTLEAAEQNGAASKTDINEIKVEILNNQQRISELSFNKSAYIKMLSYFIGENLSDSIVLEKPALNYNPTPNNIKRAELSLFNYQKMLVESKYELSKSLWYPKIGLMGFGVFIDPGVQFGTSELSRILVGGLNLSWEIGGLYKHSNNIEIAQIGLQKIETEKETFLFNTNIQLTQIEKEIEKLHNKVEKDKEILELKREIKKSYEVKYNNGTATMTRLLEKINDENIAYQTLLKDEIEHLMKINSYKTTTGN